LFPNAPYFGNWLWTTPKNRELIEKNGTSDPDEGNIQLRIATQIGYDRRTDSFICGPECNEETIVQNMKEGGFEVVSNERHSVNGVPIWLLEATPSEPGNGPKKIYLAYLATLIDTNAVVLTYGPPTANPVAGVQIWTDIKNAVLSSPPNDQWKAAMVDRPRRITPPITLETKLPSPTARVMKCLEAVKRAANRLGYRVDNSGVLQGRISVVSTGPAAGVTITMRFVDFGPEIVVASDLKAFGSATDKMPKAQRDFFNAFAQTIDRSLPVIGAEDMESLALLPQK